MKEFRERALGLGQAHRFDFNYLESVGIFAWVKNVDSSRPFEPRIRDRGGDEVVPEDALWAAYEATAFDADTPVGHVRIRIGESSPLLEELLQHAGAEVWVFVTAWNPASRELDSAENRARNRALRTDLSELGCEVFDGLGQPLTGSWTAEESFLALGIDRAQSVELGKRHGQNAVVWGRRGRAAELVDCREMHDGPRG